ncbi:uncharacterized protein LOC141904197 [Tubulanus polymorphus]|uniref:uncharacterized protein LOC141904197 n=1 Tax=Tubulanus polymorphus TaxID=672921 RepID=UPI003DA5A45D
MFQNETEFCEWLFNDQNRGATAFAHNFQSFDGYFILKYLLDQAIRPEIIPNGGKIMYMYVQQLDLKILDTLNYLPMRLAKIPSTLGLRELKKGYFPYKFCTVENLNYVGALPALEMYNPDGLSSGEREKLVAWYNSQKGTVFNMQQELTDYCRSDVDILMNAVVHFQQLLFDLTGIDPFHSSITIASACNEALRTCFLEPNTIALLPPGGYRPNANFSKMAIIWLRWVSEKQGIRLKHALNGGEERIGKYSVDGYDEATITVYEFHGCLFHGCPKCYSNPRIKSAIRPTLTIGELYQATVDRAANIRGAGYNLIEFWEHDYHNLIRTDAAFKEFVQSSDILPPLEPRECFYGGRTNAIKLYHKVSEDERIKYIDICSLYPFVNSRYSYPIGHPTVVTENFGDIRQYYGLVKCTVLPPRKLFLPVLPYRSGGKLTFPLCRTCVDEINQDAPCQHTDRERQLTGEWVTLEVIKALDMGYQIVSLHEVWHWSDNRTGLFKSYIDKFLKVKTESSGWPSGDMSDDERLNYIAEYAAREGIQLDGDKIEKIPGLRTVAKLCLNSMWGKFGQNSNKTSAKYISDPGEFYELILDSAVEISDIIICNDDVLRVHYKTKSEFVKPNSRTNVAIAAFTTAHARLILYTYTEKLGDRTLYTDTDSIIYSVKPGEWEPDTGNFLGDMTDELGRNCYITEFVSGGPKNYSYKVLDTETNRYSYECKVKGINLNYRNSQVVNFKSTLKLITGDTREKLLVNNPGTIKRDIRRGVIYNKDETKTYRAVYTKRAFDPGNRYNTLPFGY